MAERLATMYDSVSADQLPRASKWIAGYADGRFANMTAIRQRFPKAHLVAIATSVQTNAMALDIETGDASVSEAPGWVARQLRRGVDGPILYIQISRAQELVDELERARIPRHQFRLWTAHWTHKPHICNPTCGFGFKGTAGATQWTDRASDGNYDTTLMAPRFYATLQPQAWKG